MSRIYRGRRWEDGRTSVTVGVREPEHESTFALAHHVRHSPDGFNWGYGGSGPAELARCILIDHFEGQGPRIESLYQDFKAEVIAPLQGESFELTSEQIDEWVRERERDRLL